MKCSLCGCVFDDDGDEEEGLGICPECLREDPKL